MSIIKDIINGKATFKDGKLIRKKKSKKPKKYDSSSDEEKPKRSMKSKKYDSSSDEEKPKVFKLNIKEQTLFESDKKRIKDIEDKQKKEKKRMQIKKLLEYNNKMDKIDKLLSRIEQLERPLAREEGQQRRSFLSRYFEPTVDSPRAQPSSMSDVPNIRPLKLDLSVPQQSEPFTLRGFSDGTSSMRAPISRDYGISASTPRTPVRTFTPNIAYHVPNINPTNE